MKVSFNQKNKGVTIIELKLRAWDERLKFYTYSWTYVNLKDFFIDIHGHGCILELFTGSKDKDGQDIYDGDKCEYIKEYSYPTETETVTIYWEKRTNGFRVKGDKTNSYGKKSSSIVGSMLKVNGHIHLG